MAARGVWARESAIVLRLRAGATWLHHTNPAKVKASIAFEKWFGEGCGKLLDLKRCDLVSLPWADLRAVAHRIKILDVSSNALTGIPGEFLAACTALHTLHCNDNKLSSLPAELGACTALHTLDCTNNELVDLPAGLGACTKLRDLYCSYNKLSSLPEDLSACTALDTLCCRFNQLSALPVQLGLLSHLGTLDCKPNPFTAGAPQTLQDLRAAALAQSGRLTKRARVEEAPAVEESGSCPAKRARSGD